MTRPLTYLALGAALGAGALGSATRAGRVAAPDRPQGATASASTTATATASATATATATTTGTAPASATQSPATESPQVVNGERLFVSYNCGDCHGAGGAGAMAPSLQDNRWHYGGSQAQVFRSIAEGRPGGMPTWGAIIPGPEMVALAAYVSSLGAGKDLTTENFTGATVERSGR